MKIILDARKVDDYGIGEYIKNLFSGIIESEYFETKIVSHADSGQTNFPNGKIIHTKSENYNFKEHFEIPRLLNKYKDFFYFSPHYVFPYFLKNNLIVTVHDLIHFKFPHFFKPRIRVELAKAFIKKIKKDASLIFTVSETTKNDMVEMFGFNGNKIKVIYNGLSEDFFNMEKTTIKGSAPYILYAGNFKPHKNIPVLLKAFKNISMANPEIELILAGVTKNKTLEDELNGLDIKNRVKVTGYVPRKKLIEYIDNSLFFVFPSLYEGFGFPPLEAMARKKAVISSPAGSLGEVLGDSALNFDPNSPDDLTEKISQFINDQELLKKYEAKGFAHSKNFTINRSVGNYIKILKEI
ncbi:MAG: glycosyltransferase family 1 protein [Acidobacteriota bacterium]